MIITEFIQATKQTPTFAGMKNHHLEPDGQISLHPCPLACNPITADVSVLLVGKVDAPPPYNNLKSIRSIIFSVMLSVPLWAGIAAIVWAMLH